MGKEINYSEDYSFEFLSYIFVSWKLNYLRITLTLCLCLLFACSKKGGKKKKEKSSFCGHIVTNKLIRIGIFLKEYDHFFIYA